VSIEASWKCCRPRSGLMTTLHGSNRIEGRRPKGPRRCRRTYPARHSPYRSSAPGCRCGWIDVAQRPHDGRAADRNVDQGRSHAVGYVVMKPPSGGPSPGPTQRRHRTHASHVTSALLSTRQPAPAGLTGVIIAQQACPMSAITKWFRVGQRATIDPTMKTQCEAEHHRAPKR